MEKRVCFWGKITSVLFAVLLVTAFAGECGAQSLVGCYDSQGHYRSKGSSWTEVMNGVTYDCVCDGGSSNGVSFTARGSNGSSNTSFETDLKLMFVQAFVNFLFSDNSTTISDEEKQQKEKQIKEQQKELERINAENEKQRILKEKLAQELHNKLMALYKMLPDSGNLQEKKLLTDFFDKKSFDGDSNAIGYKGIDDASVVDLRFKTGVVGDLKDRKLDSLVKSEQNKYDNNFEEWSKEFNNDIIKRIEKTDPYISSLYASLKAKVPPPLTDGVAFKDLQPGDIVLVGNEEGGAITKFDNWLSNTDKSNASHTLLYLKEENGKKLFLDSQPGEGPRIITEDQYKVRYGHRPSDVAHLLTQPVKPEDGDKLYREAHKLAKENLDYTLENSNKIFTGTRYGLKDQDMVCSEVDRWVLIKSGYNIPESEDFLKKKLGVDYSPADYYKSCYFMVRPLYITK